MNVCDSHKGHLPLMWCVTGLLGFILTPHFVWGCCPSLCLFHTHTHTRHPTLPPASTTLVAQSHFNCHPIPCAQSCPQSCSARARLQILTCPPGNVCHWPSPPHPHTHNTITPRDNAHAHTCNMTVFESPPHSLCTHLSPHMLYPGTPCNQLQSAPRNVCHYPFHTLIFPPPCPLLPTPVA